MKTPDFAYPKTVEKNASAQLDKALDAADWPSASEAVIQIVTATNIVSRNQAPVGIAKIDSIASVAPAIWRPAFLLMEADLFNSIYNSIQWKANSRKISTDSIPADPYEWSRDIFALKIHELCQDILDIQIPGNAPLKDWNKILADTSDAYADGMTLEEFICQRCFTILNGFSDATKDVIPFFADQAEAITPTQKCARLRDKAIDRLIESAATGKRMMILADALSEKANTLPYGMRMKSQLEALEKVKGSAGEQLILGNLRDYISEDPVSGLSSAFPYSTAEYLEILRQSVSTFPQGRYSNNLRNIINDLTRPFAEIRYNSQYLSATDIIMDTKLTNCNSSWVLVYDYSPYINAQRSPKTREVSERCRLVKAAKVTVEGEVPFSGEAKASIGNLPKGTYVVIPSATPDKKGIYASVLEETWRQPFNVSDISVLTLPGPDAATRVFVVDGANGKPIEGAEVKVYTKKNYSSPRTLLKTYSTDKEGSVTVSAEKFVVEASFNGSKWSSNSQYYNTAYRRDSAKRIYAQVLPDKAIFHPGDSVRASIVAYSSCNLERSLEKNACFKVALRDANYKEVESDSILTDGFGRATVEFKIPEQGLLGNWQIIVYDKNRSIDQAFIQVADYVAPTFFISADESDNEVNPGDIVRLKGQVMTYSGMPVSGAIVKYNVTYTPPFRWFMHSSGSFDSSVTADSEGKYEIELPTANLKGTQFERGLFSVHLSATSMAGETQTGPVESFAIGKEYYITPYISDSKINISDSIPALQFFVNDMLGKRVKKELTYKLINKASNSIVAQGEFMSPSLSLPAMDYQSALYSIEVKMKDDEDIKADSELIFWRKSDKAAPEGTSLWVPDIVFTAMGNQKELNVTVGSGIPDRWIFGVLSTNSKILNTKWYHVENDNISLPVEAPTGQQDYKLNLSYLSNLKFESKNVLICPSSADDKLQLSTETFRDKVSAGDRENWKFRFYRNSGYASDIPAMAVMTDAALNAITPFKWNFNPKTNGYPTFYQTNGFYNRAESVNANIKITKYLSFSRFSYPYLNDYGMDWGFNGGLYYDGGVAYVTEGGVKNEMKLMRSAAPMAMKMSANTAMETVEYAMDDMAEVEAESEESVSVRGTGDTGAPDSEVSAELRDTECPVAFFMPDLVSDKDGVVSVDFTVPNFNTTWAFQLVGYDSALQVAKTALESVASKPIMVSTHSPRFVRTGDVIDLTATVFNNSGVKCAPKCRIELVDLISGKTIASKDFKNRTIEIAGSCVISLPWTVPSNVSSIGFRAYAEVGNHRDGEQALLPVLPASSPVVESTPFWIAPEGETLEVKLPKFKDTDQVTLQYCDNPAWYCISALPDIVKPDSKSITSKMRALFGNAIAYHIISSRPNIKKGLQEMLSDSNSQFAALKSNLEKDGNLKISTLANTPWVNNAESETLRMSRLGSLLDDASAKMTISELLDDIRSLQMPDGGWSWCPEMESSSWISRDVLRHFAMIMKAGAEGVMDDSRTMIRKGVKYVDTETVKDYKKYHKKGGSLSYLLDWLYVRSAFPTDCLSSGVTGNEMKSIADKAYKNIADEWRDWSIGQKAKAATVLWRAGDHKTANEILESLRQYASESPDKGMWFDNINSGWNGMSVLQTTTLVLEAFAEIQPTNKIIDSLRQWLVLGRQYQDWGKRTYTVETVNAILTSGSDWLGKQTFQPASSNTEFHLKGKKLDIPETAKMTGAFTLSLNPKDASNKILTILRKGSSPAWGGVISQYESPILDVAPAVVPELSVRKSIVALVEGENGEVNPKEGITLKKGMKVRVTLFITAGRDMDYVAVTDERSACLEPVNQLSGYTSSDRVGFYREVRDANTNLFFGWLPKGTHVVSYDCTVSQEGTFSCGIATAQSQYSPLTVAHSGGSILTVSSGTN